MNKTKLTNGFRKKVLHLLMDKTKISHLSVKNALFVSFRAIREYSSNPHHVSFESFRARILLMISSEDIIVLLIISFRQLKF